MSTLNVHSIVIIIKVILSQYRHVIHQNRQFSQIRALICYVVLSSGIKTVTLSFRSWETESRSLSQWAVKMVGHSNMPRWKCSCTLCSCRWDRISDTELFGESFWGIRASVKIFRITSVALLKLMTWISTEVNVVCPKYQQTFLL